MVFDTRGDVEWESFVRFPLNGIAAGGQRTEGKRGEEGGNEGREGGGWLTQEDEVSQVVCFLRLRAKRRQWSHGDPLFSELLDQSPQSLSSLTPSRCSHTESGHRDRDSSNTRGERGGAAAANRRERVRAGEGSSTQLTHLSLCPMRGKTFG
jgi:hypothetical protein